MPLKDQFAGGCLCLDCRKHHGAVFHASAIEVYLGVLDQPDQFRPTHELWTVRREFWLPPFPLAGHYEHDRPDGRTEG